jgi:hypothetical protein
MEQENLEKKVSLLERVKYASIPLAFTAGACFIPDIKKKYDNLPEDKQQSYKNAALTGVTVLGAALAIFSGYKLFKDKS